MYSCSSSKSSIGRAGYVMMYNRTKMSLDRLRDLTIDVSCMVSYRTVYHEMN